MRFWRDELGAGTAPFRRWLHFLFGIHAWYYKYGPETFYTWEEIKSGKSNPPPDHLGWHCRICEKKQR